MEPIRILVIDDHQMVREGIKSSLSNAGNIEIVDEAQNGQEAIDKLKEQTVDLVLIDISMDVMDGIEATKIITKQHPEVKVLALTMHDEESNIINMLQAGALGYILKTTGMKELMEAINTVSKGETYFTKEVSGTLMKQFMKKKVETSKSENKSVEELTKREIEILKLIADEFTNQEIAEKLFISQRTVDTHRRNLIQKLNVKNTAGLVRFAFRNNITS
ncbi:response regulator transcription factor [Fulvivirgaceae bacterium BMA10]|uniref:Response regulator transcription factor n=1 Tax=Splendidivirga corallicola TaxID=3051826 RepID=A0ABT8KWA6_9BACT|nr:response regulator transcription factor [Fulvivirgaceae bacterium BMA10]